MVPRLEIGIQQDDEDACRIHQRGRTEGMMREPQEHRWNEIVHTNPLGEYRRVICGRARTKALRHKHSRRRTQSRRVQGLQPEWYGGSISYEPWQKLVQNIANPVRGEPRIDATVGKRSGYYGAVCIDDRETAGAVLSNTLTRRFLCFIFSIRPA